MELKKGDKVKVKFFKTSPLGWSDGMMALCGTEHIVDYVAFDLVYVEDGWVFKHSEVESEEPTIETQRKQVFKHLQEAPITSWEAISKYRITRLSAIIYRLRKDYNISRETIREGKKNWAKYTLIK